MNLPLGDPPRFILALALLSQVQGDVATILSVKFQHWAVFPVRSLTITMPLLTRFERYNRLLLTIPTDP